MSISKTLPITPANWYLAVDRMNAVTLNGARAYPYNYHVRSSGGFYEAVNSTADIVYGGSADAGTIDGDSFPAVLMAALNAAALTKGLVTLPNGTFPCGANDISVPSNVTLQGAGKGATILTFTGTKGLISGNNTDGSAYTENACIEGLTVSGDGTADGCGIRRVNNLYSVLRNVSVTGFETGFIEEAWDENVNIVNKGYDIDIFNCKYGAVWDRRDIAGGFPGGNNLNIYYNLMVYSTTGAITAGSIGMWHKDGQANFVIGGWTEKCDTGIQVDVGQAVKFDRIYQETCNTYAVLGASSFYTDIDSITYWVAPETLYTDAGTSNELHFSKTVNKHVLTRVYYYNTPLRFVAGTAASKEGAATEPYIGHDAADSLIFNVPTGQGVALRCNNTGIQYFYNDGDLQYLKVRNAAANVGNIGAGTANCTVNLPLAEPNTSYGVAIETDWATTWYISDKAVGSFKVNFGSVTPGGGGYFSYMLYRT